MASKKKVAEPENIKRERFLSSLKVDLTPEEIADRADRAAQILEDRDSKEQEMKASAKHQKSIIETLEAELRRLSNEVRTRSTYKNVVCERRYYYDEGTLSEVRLDTEEETHSRKLTAAEMQKELPFDESSESD